MVVNHDMSLREMQHQLEENNLHLDMHYIGTLRDKILRERAVRSDHDLLAYDIAEFEDFMRALIAINFQVLLDKFATRKEKISASREIRGAKNDIIDKKFDAGLYKRKLGVVEHRVKTSLTHEQKDRLIKTMITWGIIKPNQQDGNNDGSTPPNINSQRS